MEIRSVFGQVLVAFFGEYLGEIHEHWKISGSQIGRFIDSALQYAQ